MANVQWARLQVDGDWRLRRGAWYRVASLTPGEALLDVNRSHVPVPRASVRIVSTVPPFWTVVARPRDAKGLPTMWGDKYAVCPECRNRAPLKRTPQNMRCARCERVFRVAWEELSLEAG